MDVIQFLLYLGTRMQELKEQEEKLRITEGNIQADTYAARYDELKMLFNELKASI